MHSDIGGHKIKNGFGMGVDYFSVSNWPNESYAYYANSDMAFHPNYYNTIFMVINNPEAFAGFRASRRRRYGRRVLRDRGTSGDGIALP
jgi:hypothetical protein